jgi:hypothetical protein
MPAADPRYAPLKACAIKHWNDPPWPVDSPSDRYYRAFPKREIYEVVMLAVRDLFPNERRRSLDRVIQRVIRELNKEDRDFKRLFE